MIYMRRNLRASHSGIIIQITHLAMGINKYTCINQKENKAHAVNSKQHKCELSKQQYIIIAVLEHLQKSETKLETGKGYQDRKWSSSAVLVPG